MLKNSFIFLVALIFLISCQSEKEKESLNTNKKNHYAQRFTAEKVDGGYNIKVTNPWQGAKSETFNYKLRYEPDNNTEIKIPAERVVCMSTTHMAYIQKLNSEQTIKGLSGTNYVYNQKIKDLISQNNIKEIGQAGNLNKEKISNLNPDVIFAYVINPSELKQLNQLRELGIPVVMVADYLENTPKGKLDWLNFFSCFYDKTNQADTFFNKIAANYDSLKNRVKSINNKPDILTNIPFQGVWWVPGNNSYLAKLINDAGGNYLFSEYKGSESNPVDIETAYNKFIKADIWIHTGNANSYNEVFTSDRRLKNFSKKDKIKIFNNNKRKAGKGNDFYETGVIRPDWLLSDLINIFHPELTKKDSLIFYKKIINEK